jgi:rfaE bifunctional protein nucleotidyltransferase chain/domain
MLYSPFKIKEKIFDLNSFLKVLETWRSQGKIVFTNGCFDILHIGHVDYLEKAKELGEFLIVGLNTDASIRRLKGSERPIVEEKSRTHVIASLQSVNAVILFDEDTPYNLIKAIQPDILVKGDDYTLDRIIGADIVLNYGGKVETVPLVQGFSTSNIIHKIKGL